MIFANRGRGQHPYFRDCEGKRELDRLTGRYAEGVYIACRPFSRVRQASPAVMYVSDEACVRVNQRFGVRAFARVNVRIRSNGTAKQQGRNCQQVLCCLQHDCYLLALSHAVKALEVLMLRWKLTATSYAASASSTIFRSSQVCPNLRCESGCRTSGLSGHWGRHAALSRVGASRVVVARIATLRIGYLQYGSLSLRCSD